MASRIARAGHKMRRPVLAYRSARKLSLLRRLNWINTRISDLERSWQSHLLVETVFGKQPEAKAFRGKREIAQQNLGFLYERRDRIANALARIGEKEARAIEKKR